MTDPIRIRSYVCDRWVDGESAGAELFDPSTGDVVATVSTDGVDMKAALDHARSVGGPAIRSLSFAERGAVLKTLSGLLREHRHELYELAMANGGNTVGDARFDIDGASGTFFFYSQVAKGLGERRVLVDGDDLPIGKETPLAGRHVWVSRRGAAVCINAFNFPAWGFAEKMACAFLAGMPVVVKAATATSLVTHRIAELFVESGALPAGAWTFFGGSAGDLLDHLEGQDVLSFTGSADTGAWMRSHPRVLAKGVRVNVEADSLNAAVLGPDVAPDSDTWGLFVREVTREMTQKAGQKCTATRRILVPSERLDEAIAALTARLERVSVGDPRDEGVRMGPVASTAQLDDVKDGIAGLAAEATVAWGDAEATMPGVGCFQPPVLFRIEDGHGARLVHEREVFGPVATVVPYDGSAADAGALVARGEGSLVTSVYSDDSEFVAEAVLEIAPYNGRVYLGSADVASEAWGPGAVLPGLVHGGPGRAGAGEELGGLRGVERYMQRTALEGSTELLDAVTGG